MSSANCTASVEKTLKIELFFSLYSPQIFTERKNKVLRSLKDTNNTVLCVMVRSIIHNDRPF